MQILIAGLGAVGGALAEQLVKDQHNVTLIDQDELLLGDLKRHLDVETVTGSATSPDDLICAGIEKTDVFIATTRNDAVNVLACQLAGNLFHVPKKIARLHSDHFDKYPEIFSDNRFSVNLPVRAERLVTQHLKQLLHYPRVRDFFNFCHGKVLLLALTIRENDILIGQQALDLNILWIELNSAIVCVLRNNKSVDIRHDGVITHNDEILCLCTQERLDDFLKACDRFSPQQRRIIIGGGGNIGANLAHALEATHHVKIIEKNPQRALLLAKELDKSLILNGDLYDRDLLIGENIEATQVFCALTKNDEANIMSCLLAKQLGVHYSVVLFNRMTYMSLISESNIDQAVSPQRLAIHYVMSHLGTGVALTRHKLPVADAEAIDFLIPELPQKSFMNRRTYNDVLWPSGCLLIGIVRQNILHLELRNLICTPMDHVLVLMLDSSKHDELYNLFQG